MALTTRTVYVILVAVTGLLYFLYVAYSSIYDGQFYRSTNIKGSILTSSLRSNITITSITTNLTNLLNNSLSSKNDINNTININLKKSQNSESDLMKQVPENRKPVDKEKESNVIQKIAPVVENVTLDFLVQGIKTSSVYDSGFVIPNVEICPDFGKKLQVVIIITSAPKHVDSRMAIRQTWGHYHQRSDVGIAFLLGRTLDQTDSTIAKEFELYSDIIQANIIDSYTNLTLKSVAMLEWVDNYCNQAKFILKTDDDMFINIPKLLNFLTKHSKDKRKIFGRLARKWKPIRNKSSKYFVSTQQYRHALFPDFTTGPAYLMTNDVIHDLYITALDKTYLKLEDVYTTGIVAQDNKIQRQHVNEFYNKRVALNPCNIQKSISIHMVKNFEQYDLWKKLLDGRSKC